MSRTVKMKVYRGEQNQGQLHDYDVTIDDGMVVLDVIHRIQATQAPDLACRWNCKAGKCGSCSAEVNGKPSLMCMTRMDTLPQDKIITVEPLKAFPHVRDLVTDVSWNYTVNKKIRPFKPRLKEADGTHRMYQYEVDRVQEFRKCIECFLCQDVCHVLRNHGKHEEFAGPRFMVRLASLEMHPLDADERIPFIKDDGGVGFCNITKCCTEVCP
jgi:succinate dehydrogenase / fumarate reductase iron-sulfur subunit